MEEFDKPEWEKVRAAIQKQFDGRRKEVNDTIAELREKRIELLEKEHPGPDEKEVRDIALEQYEIGLKELQQRQLTQVERDQQERLRREMKFYDRER
jgi:hypothetical protein